MHVESAWGELRPLYLSLLNAELYGQPLDRSPDPSLCNEIVMTEELAH